VEIFLGVGSGFGAGVGFEGCEEGADTGEDAGAEGEEVEFTFASDMDEACGFELFDVVRECGGGDGQSGAGLSTAEGAAGPGDLLEELEAARVGEGF